LVLFFVLPFVVRRACAVVRVRRDVRLVSREGDQCKIR
jgi:hypothetical protein